MLLSDHNRPANYTPFILLTLTVLLSASIVRSGPPEIIWEIYAGDSLWNTSTGLSITSDGNLFFAGRTELSESGLFASWLVYTSPEDLLDW